MSTWGSVGGGITQEQVPLFALNLGACGWPHSGQFEGTGGREGKVTATSCDRKPVTNDELPNL